MGSLSQFCHQSILTASETQTINSNKNISWYLHRATDIPHTAPLTSWPTTHTHLSGCLHQRIQITPCNDFLRQCNSVSFPSQQKMFKMVHSSPTKTHFRHCCSQMSKGRCLHHQKFLCMKGLHL